MANLNTDTLKEKGSGFIASVKTIISGGSGTEQESFITVEEIESKNLDTAPISKLTKYLTEFNRNFLFTALGLIVGGVGNLIAAIFKLAGSKTPGFASFLIACPLFIWLIPRLIDAFKFLKIARGGKVGGALSAGMSVYLSIWKGMMKFFKPDKPKRNLNNNKGQMNFSNGNAGIAFASTMAILPFVLAAFLLLIAVMVMAFLTPVVAIYDFIRYHFARQDAIVCYCNNGEIAEDRIPRVNKRFALICLIIIVGAGGVTSLLNLIAGLIRD